MTHAVARLPLAKIGELGESLYEQSIRSQVEDKYFGHYLAIDILSGDFEVGGKYQDVGARLQTSKSLLNRKPDAEVYLKLIGYPATAVIGGALRPLPR